MLWVHIEIPSMRRFQCVPTTYGITNKEPSTMSIVIASFNYLKLPISIRVTVTLQQIV